MSAEDASTLKPKILLSGLAMGESPRWHAGRLWLADWIAREILSVDLDGQRELEARLPFEFPFSLDWLPDGRLLVIARAGLLRRGEPDGSWAVHADLTGLAETGCPWNEIVVDGRGNTYINNAGFKFPGGEFAPGTIALLTPDGQARRVAEGIAFPNGMAVTPDNCLLIIAESYGERLTAFEIAPDGSLGSRRTWAPTPGDHPDGICLDAEGAAWYADVGNQRCVRVREGGEVLQTIQLDRGCFACMLGGADRKTLFLVANEWQGMRVSPERTGQVLICAAPAPGAGYP